MPRKKRIWYPGAVYHIVNRGNRKSELFRDQADNKYFLNIMLKAKNKFNFQLFSYCLMINHYHLEIQTNETEIWKIMRSVNLHYAKYFNNKYDLSGHLFQDRYNSTMIENNYQKLLVSRYIHLNPVRANLVSEAAKYKWSSFGVYLGKRKSELVTTEALLSFFANNSRKKYKDYVESLIKI
ncbi:transposase [Halanaerobium hydrogeniformans]|uniref:Transposase IS200-like domain-containing protein n=1 Tax=Halanaerobium hydrogeniformans TaxID=656519 RepID=E4RPT3_HALHG|nr:transposase [Halanaerobium hydrogeniformans]ADQ13967.1 hypothetical protein Halsa_0494 [Halanaerobium hydrogeniformans]